MKLYQQLEYIVKDRIAYISLNRPEDGNLMDDVLIVELKDAILKAEQDGSAKLIVLRAHGDDFCRGYDPEYLRKIAGYNLDQNRVDAQSLAEMYFSIYRATKVIIAEVRGQAIGCGCALLSVVDFIFAAEDASFAFPEVRMGLSPAMSMAYLIRRLGETRTRSLLLSGASIDAKKAVDYRLITESMPEQELTAYVSKFAQELCQNTSPAALQLAKKMISDMQDFPLENALKFGIRMDAFARVTDDAKRGIALTLESRDLEW
ncbi:MAG: enoyl-CoA hydratase-related protein [Bacteroidota bacterium]